MPLRVLQSAGPQGEAMASAWQFMAVVAAAAVGALGCIPLEDEGTGEGPGIRYSIRKIADGGGGLTGWFPSVLAEMPTAINNRNQVAGILFTGEGTDDARGYFWDPDDGLEVLGLLGPEGFETSYAFDLDEDGAVVGHSTGVEYGDPRNRATHGFRWTASEGMIDLGTHGPTATRSEAYAIDGDLIVGRYDGSNGTPALVQGGWTPLPEPGDAIGGSALDVAGGAVVGYIEKPFGLRPARWDAATRAHADLGSLSGDPEAKGVAYGVNSRGQIAGWSTIDLPDTDSGESRAFRWEDGTMERLPTLGELSGEEGLSFGQANDLNEAGDVVGFSSVPGSKRAVLWSAAGEVVDLSQTIPSDSGWDYLWTATAINDEGAIVGVGHINGGWAHFLLEPLSP